MAKKLKAIIAKLDDVEEKYRDLYEEQDGKLVLSAEVEDHPDVANLRSALKRQKESKGDLDAYRALGTVDELTEKLESVEDGDGKDRPKASDLEKQVKKLTKENATLTVRNKSLEGGLKKTAAEKAVAEAITKAGGNPKLLSDSLLKQVAAVEDEEGNWTAVVVDHKGEPRKNGKLELVTVDDLVEGMKKDPEYQDAFKPVGLGGSGKNPRETTTPPAGDAGLSPEARLDRTFASSSK